MNHKYRITIITLSVLCVGLIVFVFNMSRIPSTESPLRPPIEETTTPEPTPTPILEASSPTTYKDLIEIFTPLLNSVITLQTPMIIVEVKGRARGTWFFEASFPVELVNAAGDTIAKGIAQADDEWMTTEFVPFHATLKFNASITQTGSMGALILKKDNPSGEPQFDDEFLVPVQFAS